MPAIDQLYRLARRPIMGRTGEAGQPDDIRAPRLVMEHHADDFAHDRSPDRLRISLALDDDTPPAINQEQI